MKKDKEYLMVLESFSKERYERLFGITNDISWDTLSYINEIQCHGKRNKKGKSKKDWNK